MFFPKSIPIRYAPNSLKSKDRKTQLKMLMKSRRLYKQNKYFTRKRLPSFKNRKSSHINDAKKLYKVESIVPGRKLSKATGCSVSALQKIVSKGEGAYFSSGSRPNQTAQSWGRARLASSITGGKSAAVDFRIIEEGCNQKKKAYILARKTRKTYKFGPKT
jgi:hypothetical protein